MGAPIVPPNASCVLDTPSAVPVVSSPMGLSLCIPPAKSFTRVLPNVIDQNP